MSTLQPISQQLLFSTSILCPAALLPYHNYRHYLPDCLNSFQSQETVNKNYYCRFLAYTSDDFWSWSWPFSSRNDNNCNNNNSLVCHLHSCADWRIGQKSHLHFSLLMVNVNPHDFNSWFKLLKQWLIKACAEQQARCLLLLPVGPKRSLWFRKILRTARRELRTISRAQESENFQI